MFVLSFDKIAVFTFNSGLFYHRFFQSNTQVFNDLYKPISSEAVKRPRGK